MEIERRTGRRARINLFCNQYIDGTPCLSEALELSMSGALVRRVLGPGLDRASYAIEISEPRTAEGSVWICAAPVWRIGNYEALRFVSQSETDRLRLADLLSSVAPLYAA
jgi:hypothetical protein